MLYRESIFMTGFPGFIAGRLVERLAKPETQFFLLVQPQFVPKAIAEIEEIAEATSTSLESFVIVEGDITKPNLGIDPSDQEALRFETTDVYHLAAVYDLAVPRDLAYRVNLEGTRNVNEFVRSVNDLRRYNYVSTCYVAGKREGVILEKELEHDAGFKNYYEETKYVAEIEVERLKKELPVTIYRPSIVVGDSVTGETAKYDGIYFLIQYIRKFALLLRVFNVGNHDVRLDLVPVDFVVDAMEALAHDKKAIGKTLALADQNALTTAELFDVIAKHLSGRRSEFALPSKFVEWFLSLPFSPAVTGLPAYGVPYFFLPQTYDTRVANKLLKPHDITCPRFDGYCGNLLDFVDEFPKL